MTTLTGAFRRRFLGRRSVERTRDVRDADEAVHAPRDDVPAVDIGPNDPLLAYLQSASGAVDVQTLEMQSPALEAMKAAGVKLAVPLVSQGELIGVLNLGPRRSEQDYSTDDRKLLDNLAAQAAPALRVGQLVREQQAEAATRQRFEQELEVAKLIQQNFLPKQLPDLPDWQVAAYYRPAREVGGDFYDVIPISDGRIGFVIGDVTDKGVPAALVMAATRSVLRASAQRLVNPGEVLERVNEHLCPDMPEKMFVTCLYGVLEPTSGRFQFANAGHDLPYVKTATGSEELRARGMPLGLMTGMAYEEKETVLAPGDSLLLHSDGVVEAHNPDGGMFGFPRLKDAVAQYPGGHELIDRVLSDLKQHTGPDAEQEDDITMVTLTRASSSAVRTAAEAPTRQLVEFEVPSAEGNERIALERVSAIVGPLGLDEARLKRLETAVGEATMNAMEHGNKYRADLPVAVRVLTEPDQVRVQIVDQGGESPDHETETPDLEAKLAGLQRPRGWGLFLIKNMVDDAHETTDGSEHVLELIMRTDPAADESHHTQGGVDDHQ
ncbi:MAG: Serine phosphatase RsbU, regulator of sigma subunit [uncultured Nocardioidaceae bacterium]|uniref:Serine phosphatase RsbU, regulator of sigma subunit n=1 Tax=uncultured Nocardioidaceae bacterium TaxID=253824 RepID=A0A6J4M1C9_9ACTN|nr:MAG: Serine phosphatase RsbU, regulator of sigma subunit [uncultured Nocardioidaceae bacterium]